MLFAHHEEALCSAIWYQTSIAHKTRTMWYFCSVKELLIIRLHAFSFFWTRLDNDASISSISCQNADALVTLLLIFFPFGICDEASRCVSLKQRFPAMKSLSVGKAFSKSTVELSKDLIRMLILCPLSSVFRRLMASHWRLFTIWGCEACYLAA